MKFSWVTPTNVSQVANALLQIDSIALKQNYRQDASYFADQLHRALKQYQTSPQGKTEQKTWLTIEGIESKLIRLMTEVRLFLSLLTPEARQKLAQQFEPPKKLIRK